MDTTTHGLTEDDVYCLIGYAIGLEAQGKEDMPRYFRDLARRIAGEIGMEVDASAGLSWRTPGE